MSMCTWAWAMLAGAVALMQSSNLTGLDKTGTTLDPFPKGVTQKQKSQPFRTAGSFNAEREGFEPSRSLHPYRFSRPTHSATLPPLRRS
jgi:hypothetical protein